MINTGSIIEPHRDRPVFESGCVIRDAKAAMIMIHGRGASAQSILSLAAEFKTDNVLYLAPQASNNTWYPYRFFDPVEANEPGITSGLQFIDLLLAYLTENGIPDNKIFLLGFSQGACLTLEYAARNPRNFAGVIGLSGGLIGPMGMKFDLSGNFTNQTEVFLGCSDSDFHIPLQRVNETADIFTKMGAKVIKEIYENMGHTVNEDEIEHIINLLKKINN